MSLNKVILIGRLGHDPEFRYMTSGERTMEKSSRKPYRAHGIRYYRKRNEDAGRSTGQPAGGSSGSTDGKTNNYAAAAHTGYSCFRY